jgi:hypothetical protein
MAIQVFGAQADAVKLYLAFYGAAPSNPIYTNYINTMQASSPQSLALNIGNAFTGVSSATLAAQVLANIGVSATTTNQAAYDALLPALTQAFEAYPSARGVVVYNLVNILTTLESNSTYGGAAATFNNNVLAGYTYASNTANTQTQTSGTGITLPLSVNTGDVVNGTAGNDIINASLFFNAPSGTFFQVLQSGDSVNGGAGNDTMNLGINVAGTIIPTALTSIETLNVTDVAGGTLDMTNATGLTTLNLTNSTGVFTMVNNAAVVQNLSLNAQAVGVTLGNTAASLAGTADALALTVNGLTAGVVNIGAYETVSLTSNGSAANTITTLTDSALKTLNVSGSAGVTVAGGTGVTTNTLTKIDASAATGAVTIGAAGATLGVADQSITGGSGADTFFFGANYSSSDTVAGGGGNDTIAMLSTLSAGVVANQANLSSIEILRVTDASAAGTYTPSVFGGATTLRLDTAATGAITVNYLAGASGLNLQAAQPVAAAFTLNTPGVATNDTLTLTSGTATAAGLAHTAAVTLNGTETLTISANGTTGTSLGAVTLTPTAAAEAVIVTGNSALTLGALTADSINASANTGGLVMVAGTVAAGGINITGTGAVDTLFGSANVDIINGGAGNDRILVGAAADTSQADVLTGGSGADTFVFDGNGALASLLTDSSQAVAGAPIVKITDFVAGTDKIGLIGSGGGITSVAVAATQTIGSAATIAAVYGAITPIAATAGGVGSAAVIVVSSGAAAGTYLYINDATAGVSTTADMLINITGVSGTVGAADFVFV